MKPFNYEEFLAESERWCQGKNVWIRLPLFLYMTYVSVRSLYDPFFPSILASSTYMIHEYGHLLFSYFGTFLSIFGGTFWECATPALVAWYFRKQKDFFAMAVSIGWLGVAFQRVAVYAADARAQKLELVSPWDITLDKSGHDWTNMLSMLGILEYDKVVAFFFWVQAFLATAVFLAFGGWLLWVMATTKKLRSYV